MDILVNALRGEKNKTLPFWEVCILFAHGFLKDPGEGNRWANWEISKYCVEDTVSSKKYYLICESILATVPGMVPD